MSSVHKNKVIVLDEDSGFSQENASDEEEFSEIDYLDETYEYDYGIINDENDQST